MKKKFLAIVLSSLLILTGTGIPSKPVFAATTLTVDCEDTLREVTHCASGSLYGITEDLPADINDIVKPLNPNVFTNPALSGSGYQQPIGSAIPTAGRLTNTTGKVMIRLADVFPNWPYSFTNMEDWLSKVTTVVDSKLASGYTNFYGYEIWNEPCYTWTSTTVTFKDMWIQTYKLIRSLDPEAQIIGPSEGYYNHSKMEDFLTYCKANNCLPDVVCWHELGSEGVGIEGVSKDIKDFKELESTLGIPEKKISINEYCDKVHSEEGQPGSSARYIAKFERNKVDSACISWWWTGAPGRLGSLMATNTEKGAGWWFYKWYGDMTGNMVNVTPEDDNSNKVDGFACVDSEAKYVSTLLGGVNDGTINVTLKNIPDFIGSTANVKIEKVDWTNKDNPVSGTNIVNSNNYAVSQGTINVSIPNTNSSSGYRVYVTPAISINDSEAVEYTANALEGNIVSSTKTNITLPKTGSYDTTISWTSNNPDVMDKDGVVNRTTSDKTVTLTATISKGEAIATKEFTVVVKGKLANITEKPIYKYNFEKLNDSNEVVNSGSKEGNASFIGSAKVADDSERGNVLAIKSSSTDKKVNYLALPSNTFDKMTAAGFTVGMWINVDSTDPNYSQWSSLFEATDSNAYPVTKMGADLLSRINSNGAWADTSASVVTPNTWQYAVYTVDSTGIHVYLNGNEVSSALGDLSACFKDNFLSKINDVRVGSGNIWGDRDIASAKFDNVAIYNTALTGDEVEALYNQEVSSTSGNTSGDKNISAQYKVDEAWGNQVKSNVKLTNISDKPINDWMLKADFKGDITQIWNASIVSHEGDTYIIKNSGTPEDITTGAAVEFGFIASYEGKDKPVFNNYSIVSAKQTVDEADYKVDFSKTNEWDNGFNGAFEIKNNGSKPIEDWVIEFDYKDNIKSIWNAEIVSHEGEHYVIKYKANNANIKAGDSISFGFQGVPQEGAKSTEVPKNYKLTSYINS